MIGVGEADRIMAQLAPLLPGCRCPLGESRGRILRQEIRADRDQPPYDRATMDGIALSAAEFASGSRTFRRLAVQSAGEPPRRLASSGTCVEVMTGAVLPTGCDAVVRAEEVRWSGDTAMLDDGAKVESGQNVHSKGSDARAGEVVVAVGSRLSPPDIAIAASMGAVSLWVTALPEIAVVSTGDELVAVGSRPEAHQLRRSNVHAIQAALVGEGYGEAALCHIPDDRRALATEIGALLERFDLLILSGGVSMGKFDFVPEVLGELGVANHIHKVRQRPGKPLWFGTRSGTSVFALPGNPVSAITCLYRYVLPFLLRASGGTERPLRRERLAREARGLPSLTRFLPVRLGTAGEESLAWPVETNTSGDFLSLARSDGFVEIPEGTECVPAGAALPFREWRDA